MKKKFFLNIFEPARIVSKLKKFALENLALTRKKKNYPGLNITTTEKNNVI